MSVNSCYLNYLMEISDDMITIIQQVGLCSGCKLYHYKTIFYVPIKGNYIGK